MAVQDQFKFPTTLFQCADNYFACGHAPHTNLQEVLNQFALPEEDFRNPKSHISLEQLIKCLDFIVENRDDQPPTLQVISVLATQNLGVGGMALMTVPFLSDFLEVVVNYHKLALPIVDITTRTTGSEHVLYADLEDSLCDHTAFLTELILTGLIKVVGEITNKRLEVTLNFSHSPLWGLNDDEEAARVYSEYLGCKVNFNCPRSALIMDRNEIENTRIRSANKILHDQAMSVLFKQEERRVSEQTISDKVRHILLINSKKNVYVDLEELSSQLNMSTRNLSRKLDKENVQFKMLVNEIRFNRAMKLLRNDDVPLRRIANKVGYSNPDTFIRAFKAFTGETPHQWRSAQQDSHY